MFIEDEPDLGDSFRPTVSFLIYLIYRKFLDLFLFNLVFIYTFFEWLLRVSLGGEIPWLGTVERFTFNAPTAYEPSAWTMNQTSVLPR